MRPAPALGCVLHATAQESRDEADERLVAVNPPRSTEYNADATEGLPVPGEGDPSLGGPVGELLTYVVLDRLSSPVPRLNREPGRR